MEQSRETSKEASEGSWNVYMATGRSEGQRQQVGDSTCAASVWHAVCLLGYSGKALLRWCSAVDERLTSNWNEYTHTHRYIYIYIYISIYIYLSIYICIYIYHRSIKLPCRGGMIPCQSKTLSRNQEIQVFKPWSNQVKKSTQSKGMRVRISTRAKGLKVSTCAKVCKSQRQAKAYRS